MCLGDIGKILRMNQVINALAGKLCLVVAEQILASLLKGHVAKVQFVFGLEHHFLLRHLQ